MVFDPNEPYCEVVDVDDVMLDQEIEDVPEDVVYDQEYYTPEDGVDDDDEYCEYYDPSE